jgi:hypothetical protein
VDGPHFAGEEVYALALYQRDGRRTLWAALGNAFFGTTLRRSDDFGASWSGKEERPIRFPEPSGLSLKRIWQIRPGREEEPDRLFLGVEPSCLFESADGGDSWAPVRGFLEHEHRERWTPGAGGLCLHTILADPERPERILVAISPGSVYRTDDGGHTFAAYRLRHGLEGIGHGEYGGMYRGGKAVVAVCRSTPGDLHIDRQIAAAVMSYQLTD